MGRGSCRLILWTAPAQSQRQGGPVRGPVPGPGPPCPLGLRASPPARPCAAGSASRGRSSRLLHRAGAPEDGRSVGTPSRPRRTIPRRASPRSFWVSVSPSVRCALRRMPARRSPKGKREPVAATPSVRCSRHRAPCGQGRQQQSSGRRPAGADSERNDKRQRQRPGTPPSTPGTTDSAAPWATLRPLAQARRAAEQEQAHAPIGPAMGAYCAVPGGCTARNRITDVMRNCFAIVRCRRITQRLYAIGPTGQDQRKATRYAACGRACDAAGISASRRAELLAGHRLAALSLPGFPRCRSRGARPLRWPGSASLSGSRRCQRSIAPASSAPAILGPLVGRVGCNQWHLRPQAGHVAGPPRPIATQGGPLAAPAPAHPAQRRGGLAPAAFGVVAQITPLTLGKMPKKSSAALQPDTALCTKTPCR